MVNFQIHDYLCDFNKQSKRGVCIACRRGVGWARVKVAAHKRNDCPNVTADETKIFQKRRSFANARCSDESSDDEESKDSNTVLEKETDTIQINDFLRDYDSETNYGICIACGKEVGWSRGKIASHKRRNCPNVTAEEVAFFSKNKAGDSSDEKTKIQISNFLRDFDSGKRHGICIGCGKEVGWARSKVAAHKRKNCLKASAEERKFFKKVKTSFKRKLETGDCETFKITNYFKHLKNNKTDDSVDNNRTDSSSFVDVKEEKRSLSEVNIKQEDDSSDQFNVKVLEDSVSCYICNEGFGSRRPIQVTNVLSSTGTPLYKVLESFTGIELSVETMNASGACQDCFINLEKYDSFQKKSRDIQEKVTAAYFKSRNEPVFIKQEPGLDITSTIVYTISHFANDSETPEHAETSNASSDRWNSDDSEDEPLVSPKKSQPATDRKRFQCYKCGKMSPTLGGIKIHMILEHRLRKNCFECSECSKVCPDKASMRSHYASHEKEEFLCMRCGKIFANKKYFKRHSMIHDDVRPYPCTVDGCEKSFRSPNNLRFHLRVHSGEKLFECPFCPGKRFATEWGRTLHLRAQHNSKQSNLGKDCKICGVAFENLSKLRTHLTKIHQVVE